MCQIGEFGLRFDKRLRGVAADIVPDALVLAIGKRRDPGDECLRKLPNFSFLERPVKIRLLQHRLGLPGAVLEENLASLFVTQDPR